MQRQQRSSNSGTVEGRKVKRAGEEDEGEGYRDEDGRGCRSKPVVKSPRGGEIREEKEEMVEVEVTLTRG